jgi:hypothetical protein
MERRAVVHFLTLKGLKTEVIEMKLTIGYGDEPIQTSVAKKWRMRFLQGKTELGDDPQSGESANSGLTEVIVE